MFAFQRCVNTHSYWNEYFYLFSCFSIFILNQVFLAFRSVSKHLVIGMNTFYFSSCFSRFIFNQVFLAFRSVSKHLVIGMNNFYFFSCFSRFNFNQVFLAFRSVSLKTQLSGRIIFISLLVLVDLFLIKYVLAFRSVSKHLVIGINY